MANDIVQSSNRLRELLVSSKDSFNSIATKTLTADKLIKMAIVAASRNPKLLQCNSKTVLRSVMNAAQLGLEISGLLGQGYLVPYWNSQAKVYECQFIPGYRGLIDLCRRAGDVKSIRAHVVYKKDVFECDFGLDLVLKHKPDLDSLKTDDEIRCVYAVADLGEGVQQMDLMTKQEIDAIRSRSKSPEKGPWVTDYAEMAKKTVVKRLIKYLPLSVEQVRQAVAIDNAYENGERLDIVDGMIDAEVVETPDEEKPAQAARVAEKVKARAVPPPPADNQPTGQAAPAQQEPAQQEPAQQEPAGEPVERSAEWLEKWVNVSDWLREGAPIGMKQSDILRLTGEAFQKTRWGQLTYEQRLEHYKRWYYKGFWPDMVPAQ